MICSFCQQAFPKPSHRLSERQWTERRYCSPECYWEARRGKPLVILNPAPHRQRPNDLQANHLRVMDYLQNLRPSAAKWRSEHAQKAQGILFAQR